MKFYECKVRYDKVLENGTQKKVNEIYLCDAVSISDAERIVVDELSSFICGEFEVIGIKKVAYSEVVNQADGQWFKAKIYFVSLDEKTGVEKKTAGHFLIHAENIDKAKEYIETAMKGTISEWEIGAISDTNIEDVIYSEK